MAFKATLHQGILVTCIAVVLGACGLTGNKTKSDGTASSTTAGAVDGAANSMAVTSNSSQVICKGEASELVSTMPGMVTFFGNLASQACRKKNVFDEPSDKACMRLTTSVNQQLKDCMRAATCASGAQIISWSVPGVSCNGEGDIAAHGSYVGNGLETNFTCTETFEAVGQVIGTCADPVVPSCGGLSADAGTSQNPDLNLWIVSYPTQDPLATCRITATRKKPKGSATTTAVSRIGPFRDYQPSRYDRIDYDLVCIMPGANGRVCMDSASAR